MLQISSRPHSLTGAWKLGLKSPRLFLQSFLLLIQIGTHCCQSGCRGRAPIAATGNDPPKNTAGVDLADAQEEISLMPDRVQEDVSLGVDTSPALTFIFIHFTLEQSRGVPLILSMLRFAWQWLEFKAMVLDAGLPISSGKDINAMLDVGGSILGFQILVR